MLTRLSVVYVLSEQYPVFICLVYNGSVKQFFSNYYHEAKDNRISAKHTKENIEIALLGTVTRILVKRVKN